MFLAAVLAIGSQVHGAELLVRLDEGISGYVWTSKDRLVLLTPKRVIEWPSMRSLPIRRAKEVPHDIEYSFEVSRDGTLLYADDTIVNLRTLESKAFEPKALGEPYERLWIMVGNDVREIRLNGSDRTAFLKNGKKELRLAPGWLVLSLESQAGRLIAYATKKEPYDWVDTSMLEINPRSGRPKVLATFPKSSDDHSFLESCMRVPNSREWIGHSVSLAAEMPSARKGPPGKMHFLKLPETAGASFQTTQVMSVDSRGRWALIERTLFGESGEDGFDGTTVDLYDLKTKEHRPLAVQINRWRSDPKLSDTVPPRGQGPVVGSSDGQWKYGFVTLVKDGNLYRIWL